jgi:NlpC/P60 family putative phage cell wall peptidase
VSSELPLTRPFADAKGHPLPPGERVTREDIVAAGRSWIGTPYRHQASLKGVGCDCLGLLVGVWREVMGEEVGPLPPYTPDWAEASGRETLAEGLAEYLTAIDPKDAREGDIVLFRWRAHLPAKHAGILTAADRMVHAQEKAAVSEVALSDWRRRRKAFAFVVG